jgi:hypothetical protein
LLSEGKAIETLGDGSSSYLEHLNREVLNGAERLLEALVLVARLELALELRGKK